MSGSPEDEKVAIQRRLDKHNSACGSNSKKGDNVHDSHDVQDNVSWTSQGFEEGHGACDDGIVREKRA